MPMARSESLRRRLPFREAKRRFLIVCEGDVTEPKYFTGLRIHFKSLVDLHFKSGATPKTLVEWAVQLKNEDSEYDEVWCVFDIDEHPFVPEAKQQAKDNQIDVAISNPSFELWLLLHFQEQNSALHRRKVRTELKKHIPGYEKDPPRDKLIPLHKNAVQRAEKLAAINERNNKIGANPSTEVHLLTERITKQIHP